MSYQAAQEKVKNLKRMGLTGQGVKKGSRIIPLLSLLIVIFVFIGNLGDSKKTDPLHELMSMYFSSDPKDTRSPDAHIGEVQASNALRRGRNLLEEGKTPEDLENAKKAFIEAVQHDPKAVKAVGEIWFSHHMRVGRNLLEEGKKREAQHQFSMAKQPHEALLTEERSKEIIRRSIFQNVVHFLPVFTAYLKKTIKKVENDFQVITTGSLWTVVVLVLYALVAGVLGMIYRRAFWTWFLVAFGFLAAINTSGVIGQISNAELTGNEGLYVIVTSQLLLLLLAFRLRRHSTDSIREPVVSQWLHNTLLAAGLALLGAALYMVAYGGWSLPQPAWLTPVSTVLAPTTFPLPAWEVIMVGLPTLYMLFKKRVVWESREPKNIVVCLDGTWNNPGMTDFGHLSETNVYKLFKTLKEDNPTGDMLARMKRGNGLFDASICKRFEDKQIAFYYTGVGSTLENSKIGELLGGGMGLGAAGIIERAYLDVMRVWRPGDRIFITGFSRGAAISRLLARAIDKRGAPRKMWTLKFLGRHWVLWKSHKDTYEVPITVLGCWDTVGSFGIPKDIGPIKFHQLDLFKDLTVPMNVEQAYHMVALDETRDMFEPTLMEPDPINPNRIVEVWFSGSHANVGGGYATDQLSDVTLDFLLKHISSGYAHAEGMKAGAATWGIYLTAVKKGLEKSAEASPGTYVVDPDPKGQLRFEAGGIYDLRPRKLPLHAVVSDTVFKRMKDALPVYAPDGLFKLNAALVAQRDKVVTEVTSLWETNSLNDEERQRILNWSKEKLSLAKWLSEGLAGVTHEAPPQVANLSNDPASWRQFAADAAGLHSVA